MEMEEVLIEEDTITHVSKKRPSLEQFKAVVDFMQKHPDLANPKMITNKLSRPKIKKLWAELSNIANALPGMNKTTQEWMRFWADKKCMIKTKKKQVDNGSHSSILTPIEEQIWTLCFQNGTSSSPKRRKSVKTEVSDDDSSEEQPLKRKKTAEAFAFTMDAKQAMSDVDERQMAIMEKLVEVMDRQASALSQLAQSSGVHAQAMERLAEASQQQAQAVDRLATSFEGISAAAHDVRNAIINIDYTMKRCYTINQT